MSEPGNPGKENGLEKEQNRLHSNKSDALEIFRRIPHTKLPFCFEVG